MIKYILKKISYGSLVLFGVLTLVFFLFQIMPGDPARMMLSQRDDAKQLEIIKQKYGFDKPIIDQYLIYLNDVSPLSLHDNSHKDNYTSTLNGKYTGRVLFEIKDIAIMLKLPYFKLDWSFPALSVGRGKAKVTLGTE